MAQQLNHRQWLALVLTPALAIGFALLVLRPAPTAAPPPPLPDLSELEPAARKDAFFDYLRPLVADENAAQLNRRALLIRMQQRLAAGGTLGRWQQAYLQEIAAAYRIDVEHGAEEILRLALKRVDALPESLVLIQAAKESGWGTSRFALEANNLFGEWCFSPGCGLVPQARRPGRRHEVRAFATPAESVHSYMMNLNTHPSYRELRLLREQLRATDTPVTGLALAEGLVLYSERRDAYVDEIKALILQNALEPPPTEASTTESASAMEG